ncbi:SurA N-terminal domain-containing protein [Pseudalkalibacillus hwajinpoensis]|uniref:SurA N-terminal domain-containing protein n=1 Tax=Guptibacillus hwajinpoensis TaxID=208199 RepID=UPI00146B216B|nr:SurA N-terminal domain-containing protein [Pseudalkalibacillus hwajinpoensis]
MRKLTYLLITGLVLVALAACGGNENSSNDKKQEDTKTEEKAGEQKQPEVDKVDADKVMATVNGTEITGEDFNPVYENNQMQYVQMGQEVPKEQLEQMKKQIVDSLVGQELILQDAKDKGYEASEEQVDKELKGVKEEFENEDQFKEALKKNDMSVKELRKQLADNVLYSTYVEKEIKVDEVSEEDMKKSYEKAKEQGGSEEMPAYEDVKPQIKESLEKEQLGKKMQELVEKLKKDADVKTNV